MPKAVMSGDRLKLYSLKLKVRQIDALQRISVKWGVPVAEQIRRGVDLWLRSMESSK